MQKKYEDHHKVLIHDSALVAAVQLSCRYISERFLPDKALDLLDEVCAKVRVQMDSETLLFQRALDLSSREHHKLDTAISKIEDTTDENSVLTKTVGPDQITKVVSLWTGIPVTRLGTTVKERLSTLSNRLHQRVAGQDQAIRI